MTTRIDDARAVELASLGMSNVSIAEELNCDEASVRRALRRTNFSRHLIPVDLESRFHFNLDRPLVLKNLDAMITADWHVPLYDPRLVNDMIETAQGFGIKSLVMAGDFFNFDALSAYDPKQDEAHLTREYKEGLAVMRVLTETFDRIFYVWGNHDARMHKALGYAMKFRDAMKMVFGALGSEVLAKIEFTNLDHLWMVYGEPSDDERLPEWHRYPDRWYVCHPQNYSRVPLSTPRAMIAKQNASVITAHAHHCAVGFGTDGKHVAAEIGGLFDAGKTAYLQRSTTFPHWVPGYGWLRNGRFHLTSPRWETA